MRFLDSLVLPRDELLDTRHRSDLEEEAVKELFCQGCGEGGARKVDPLSGVQVEHLRQSPTLRIGRSLASADPKTVPDFQKYLRHFKWTRC